MSANGKSGKKLLLALFLMRSIAMQNIHQFSLAEGWAIKPTLNTRDKEILAIKDVVELPLRKGERVLSISHVVHDIQLQ